VATADQEVVGDTLLLAVGRRPTVDGLGLENARVEYNPIGIKVNEYLRTSQRHIYAAGDCAAGGYQFTHYAGYQGFMAARNALLPGDTRAVLDRVPWATFTDPEVAHAGMTEAQAREKFGDRVEVCSWSMERVDRALTEADTVGFIKLIHQRDGAILGVTIANERAGEMIHEWILALDQGLKINDIVKSIHIYPTYSIASQQIAFHIWVAQLLAGASGKIIKALTRFMR
jgi:pyruvate/2-oxoglutarate dehydrogenase complex dihydrolipoamide dehydrogenase (E3) component